ncbi:hypothetical protein BC829DRAFT_420099 [Chytridium lagenaria]|nr:hypothetical protein BC829DRAFT_420099 [Chytridium lagenaria]
MRLLIIALFTAALQAAVVLMLRWNTTTNNVLSQRQLVIAAFTGASINGVSLAISHFEVKRSGASFVDPSDHGDRPLFWSQMVIFFIIDTTSLSSNTTRSPSRSLQDSNDAVLHAWTVVIFEITFTAVKFAHFIIVPCFCHMNRVMVVTRKTLAPLEPPLTVQDVSDTETFYIMYLEIHHSNVHFIRYALIVCISSSKTNKDILPKQNILGLHKLLSTNGLVTDGDLDVTVKVPPYSLFPLDTFRTPSRTITPSSTTKGKNMGENTQMKKTR